MNKYKKLILMILFIISLFIGIYNKEPSQIYNKASAICLECCGIG